LFINEQWASFVLGALEPLRWPDVWSGTSEEKETAVQHIQELLSYISGAPMDCFAELTSRLDALIACCTFQYQLQKDMAEITRNQMRDQYDGTPHSLDEDSPTDKFSWEDGDELEYQDIRDAALCDAIERWIKTLMRQLRLDVQTGCAFVEVGAILLVVDMPVVGLIATVAVGLACDWIEATFEDEDAMHKVACCMYSALYDKDNTFDAFSEGLGECGFEFGSPEAQQAQAVSVAMNDQGNYLAFVRALGESTRRAEGGVADTEFCICDDDNYYDFCEDDGGFFEFDPPSGNWEQYECRWRSEAMATPHIQRHLRIQKDMANAAHVSRLQFNASIDNPDEQANLRIRGYLSDVEVFFHEIDLTEYSGDFYEEVWVHEEIDSLKWAMQIRYGSVNGDGWLNDINIKTTSGGPLD
jgi:hypothetical protein